jgi:hypothetical protein
MYLLLYTEYVKFGMEVAENDSRDLANLGGKLTGLNNGKKTGQLGMMTFAFCSIFYFKPARHLIKKLFTDR